MTTVLAGGLGFHHADGLVLVGVEFFAQRVDFDEAGFFEGRHQLLERQLDAALEVFDAGGLHLQRGFQAVLDRQQFAGKLFDGVFVGVGDVGLGALADVFRIGLGAQPGIVMLLAASSACFSSSSMLGMISTVSSTADACAASAGCSVFRGVLIVLHQQAPL